MSALVSILALSFLGSIAGLLGGLVLLWKEKFAKDASIYLISFAAGVILSAAFLDLLPEAIGKGGENVFVLILFGLVAFFLIEDLLLHFHHHETHEHSLKTAVPLVVFGDSIHNFIDGVVISATFMTDPKLGTLVAVATFFHEVPQEIGDFAVLLSTGMSKLKVVFANLVSAVATFFGAILTYFFVQQVEGFVGPLLALATGMFLYIASADILPELVHGGHKNLRWQIASSFILGIALIFFLTKFIPD